MQKKGISLIVLVITIIVMIILAAAIIISLNNTGIIGNANKAVDETNEKTVQEIANLAWGEAYANGARNVTDLKDAVEKALENNDLNVGDYGINVTESGVDIKKGWLQTSDRTVIKGDQVLNIGDTINYDETNGGKVSGLTNVDWKVLGAENGELLIMSDTDIVKKKFNENNTLEGGQAAYINCVNELNEICKVYGTGKGAIKARSINIDDIDRVTGYDKIKYEYADESYKIKYGESVTYYWDTVAANQKKPYYETERGVTGNLSSEHSKFIYYDGKTHKESVMPTTLPNQKQKICTLTQTNYYYDVDEKTTLTKTNIDGTTNKAYKLLFGNDDVIYWLASSCVDVSYRHVLFATNYVTNGWVSAYGQYTSYGLTSSPSTGVRAVVCLSSNVSLKEIAAGSYDISID